MATKAKTLADFRTAHDQNVIIPNKIRTALAAMLKEGPEQWEYEADFMRRAGIGQVQIGQFRDQFEDHIALTATVHGVKAKRVWFADPKVAKRVRGE